MSKILSIQFMRAVACLLVIQQHFFSVIPFTDHKINGTIGVDLFFVISGYIIAASIEKIKNNPFKTFFINRFSRIIPYYFLITTILIFIDLVRSHPIDKYQLLHTFTFIPSRKFDPYVTLGWSLNHEILFYVFVTICLVFTRKIRLIIVLFFLFITMFQFIPTNIYFLEFLKASINYTFLGGMVVYLFRDKILIFFANDFYLIVISTISILFVMYFTMDHQLDTNHIPIVPVRGYFRDIIYFNNSNFTLPRFFVQGIPSLLFFIAVLSKEKFFAGMDNSLIIKIGNASFSEYLLQIFGLKVVGMLNLDMLASVPLVIGLIAFSLYFVKIENIIGTKSKHILNNIW